MEKQKCTALMALDLSAAFDTVDHNVLFSVLEQRFGLDGSVMSWFKSYLNPRYCKVNVGKEYSKIMEFCFSVPQGSCAGPQLYSAYASTLPEAVDNSLGIHGFADDHAVKKDFTIGREEQTTINLIETNATSINTWMDKNRLKMNQSKTEFIIFGSSQQLQKCETKSLNVNGTEVCRTQEIKYLGAMLDESLNLKSYIKNQCRKAMCNIYKLKHIRNYLTIEACKVFASGMILSHLDYCNAILCGLPKSEINKLQRIQNMAAKIILQKRKSDSASKCLAELHWLPVQKRIDFKVLTMVYKCLNGNAPEYLKRKLSLHTGGRNLRSDSIYQRLRVPSTQRATFADRSFSVYGPKKWNELPNYIKQSTSLELFKSKLKTYLFSL